MRSAALLHCRMKIQSNRQTQVKWKHLRLQHPCAHIVYHEDLRKLFGIIRLKAKTGSKEAQYCAYVDGTTADNLGYVKSDLLRVDVVKIIDDTFKTIGIPTWSADELLQQVQKHPQVWSQIYDRGMTQCVNQCEKPKTTERVMRFKPRNPIELAAFVASIRPEQHWALHQ